MKLDVILGLIVGKFIGITGARWPLLKMGLADLAKITRFTQIAGVSLLTGIGFTMSIFAAQLGFEGQEAIQQSINTATYGVIEFLNFYKVSFYI